MHRQRFIFEQNKAILKPMKKVLLSYTTYKNPDPKKHLQAIKEAGINDFAIFLSTMPFPQRQRLFLELDQMPGISIPCCHARTDILPEELDYMIEHYGTKMFNIHAPREMKIEHNLDKYKDKIYIENSGRWIDESDLDGFAGICLDLTHLKHSQMAEPETYKKMLELIPKYKIGFNHVSALGPAHRVGNSDRYDYHYLTDLSQLDYLKEFPQEYFGEYIAIELGNDVATQLKIKEYIENIISL